MDAVVQDTISAVMKNGIYTVTTSIQSYNAVGIIAWIDAQYA